MCLQCRTKSIYCIVSNSLVLFHDEAGKVSKNGEPKFLHYAKLHRFRITELLGLILFKGWLTYFFTGHVPIRRWHIGLKLCYVLILNSILRLHSELAFEVLGVDDLALRCGVALDYFGLLSEPSGAEDEQVDGSSGLLGVAVLGELAQTVDKFNKDFF